MASKRSRPRISRTTRQPCGAIPSMIHSFSIRPPQENPLKYIASRWSQEGRQPVSSRTLRYATLQIQNTSLGRHASFPNLTPTQNNSDLRKSLCRQTYQTERSIGLLYPTSPPPPCFPSVKFVLSSQTKTEPCLNTCIVVHRPGDSLLGSACRWTG